MDITTAFRTSRASFLLLVVFSGCKAPLDFGTVADSLIPGRESVEAPLAYYEWSLSATTAQLAQEQDRLESLEDLDSDPVLLVQLSVVNMALGMNDRNESGFENLRTLGQNCTTRTCRNYISLATLLDQLTEARSNLEAARAGQAEEQQHVSTLRSQLATLQQRITSLQAQIDALTSLEQEIIQREFNELSR